MLPDGRQVIVNIPAYNEEQRIAKALIGMPDVVDLILVVNDGSTDRTVSTAIRHGATVISIPKHTNLDTALRTGFEVALRDRYDIIVVMAGNGKDDPRQIPRLLKPIEEQDFDFVQGSRYLPGGEAGSMPLHRRLGTHLYPWLIRSSTGFPATDGTNGFRVFKASILGDSRIDIYQSWLGRTGMEFYFALKVIQLGYRVIEVPVSKIYPNTNRYHSYTKVKPVKDWWNILKPWFYLTLGLKR